MLFRFCEEFGREYAPKMTGFVDNNLCVLHYGNASSQKVIVVQEFCCQNSTIVINQAPDLPHMALFDFFLFQKLKLPLQERNFEFIEAAKENSLKKLKSKPQSTYEKCIEDWAN